MTIKAIPFMRSVKKWAEANNLAFTTWKQQQDAIILFLDNLKKIS